MELEGLSAALQQADAEALPFANETFDLVYSFWHELEWRLYARGVVRSLGNRFGLNLVIEAIK